MIKVIENMGSWKNVCGFGGAYQVSRNGLVRSVDRKIIRSDGVKQVLRGRLLEPNLDSSGYAQVSLHKNGKKKTALIHHLVCTAFISERPTGLEVNHIDGNKLNNNVENLEYVTKQRNMEHFCSRHYKFISPDGEKMQIYNLRKFCRESKLDQGAMCHVHSGKNSHHKGWVKWV